MTYASEEIIVTTELNDLPKTHKEWCEDPNCGSEDH